jgi:GTP-binding protein
MIRNL